MDELKIRLYDARPDAGTYGGLLPLGILPPAVAEAMRVVKAIKTGQRAARERPQASRSAAQDATVLLSAARAGEPFPDLAVDPESDARARQYELSVWDRAEQDAAGQLESAERSTATATYTGPLRRLLAETLQAVRAESDRQKLAILAERYRMIREAQVRLRPFLPFPPSAQRVDTTELLWEIRNLRELFGPERWISARQNLDGWRPWPQDPIERLVWLAGESVQAWLPLPAEQDEAFVEENERAVREQRASFRRRQAEAAERGEVLVVEGASQEHWDRQARQERASARPGTG